MTGGSFLVKLRCSRCGTDHDADIVQTVCRKCAGTLFSYYDTEAAKARLKKDQVARRPASMWRYKEMLPVRDERNVITLGEGMTPITPADRTGAELGVPSLLVKDDGVMPTGTFKARGQSTAISRAKELGIKKVALASAGNAGAAAATYAARAGLKCFVFMPKDAPDSVKKECSEMGANLRLVDGLISDAGRYVRDGQREFGWFDLSTLREPYRVEGKKTMGYEIAEQLGWELPDAIVYPTGGGTGLIGMWKAFREMEELGWLGSKRPRMVAVQSEGCAPVVKAFAEGKDSVDEPWAGARTIADGLRVPFPYASEQALKVVRESGGTAVAVKDNDIFGCMRELARNEGLFVCPEGAATLAGLKLLVEQGEVEKDERVLLYNTGSGLKYLGLVDAPSLGAPPWQ